MSFAQGALPQDWLKARSAQDRAALERIAAAAVAAAEQNAKDAKAQYQGALAESLRAEVMAELKDKKASGSAAESGIKLAERAIAFSPNNAEYHRLLGALCGQTIPANILFAMRYGRCALDEVNKAVQLDPKGSMNYLSRGVGNYYLPESFGGGPAKALDDVQKAVQLDAKNADAWLWNGIILRKLGRNGDAHSALVKALALDPGRIWTKQQLDKTPEK